MASALLRMSVRRGSVFHRVISAAATAPSGREGLAARRAAPLLPSPLRRLQHSASEKEIELLEKLVAQNERLIKASSRVELLLKVKTLDKTIWEVNRKMEIAHVVYASVQRKRHNPLVLFLLYAGAVYSYCGYCQVRERSSREAN